MNSIRIAIAEDNAFALNVIREKLGTMANVEVALTASNGRELLDRIPDCGRIDVILMDIEMPLMSGIEAASLVRKSFPSIKIIMLTIFDDDEKILEAIRAGADGYMLKDERAAKIGLCIFETLEGGAGMSPGIARRVLQLLKSGNLENPVLAPAGHDLTKREIEILEQLKEGLSYERIGENLFISYGTVRKHVENVYRKLQVHNKVEAVQKALRDRII